MSGGPARTVIVMGVSGSGKTTVGRSYAQAIDGLFVDADDLHPPWNVAKMSRGEPLNDADRAPWLDAVRGHIETTLRNDNAPGLVLACSALKRAYRERLRRAEEPVAFAWLHTDRASLAKRMRGRSGHFMMASMLDSQLATLEPPGSDEDVLALDATRPVDELVEAMRRAFVA